MMSHEDRIALVQEEARLMKEGHHHWNVTLSCPNVLKGGILAIGACQPIIIRVLALSQQMAIDLAKDMASDPELSCKHGVRDVQALPQPFNPFGH